MHHHKKINRIVVMLCTIRRTMYNICVAMQRLCLCPGLSESMSISMSLSMSMSMSIYISMGLCLYLCLCVPQLCYH